MRVQWSADGVSSIEIERGRFSHNRQFRRCEAERILRRRGLIQVLAPLNAAPGLHFRHATLNVLRPLQALRRIVPVESGIEMRPFQTRIVV